MIWERTDLSQSETLVALALADHADDEGYCWPTIDRIAEKARISRRQAQRVIARLETSGILSVDRSETGRGHTSRYQFQIKGDTVTPLSEIKGDTGRQERVTPETKRVTPGATKGDTAMSPESSITIKEPSEEPSRARKRATRLPDDFELTQKRRLVAEAERLPAERVFEKFRDYWLSASGQRARKHDWDATWRNWCRSEADRGGRGGFKQGGESKYERMMAALDADLEAAGG